ncbi:MAG TPA: arginine--tRNA ligase [Candidatus Faecicola pullistercoris]|nr:arginine--tRNA ligase [Candidatus Faecicola pullistercoris]
MDYKSAVAAAVASVGCGLSMEELSALIVVPKDSKNGDYSLPCFRFAKISGKSPVAVAQELKDKIALPEGIEKVESLAGYLNFYTDKKVFVKTALEKVLEKKQDYGKSDIGKGKTVCIDYSSVNIAKPFHIGHLSSTAIGGALYRIFGFLGYTAVGINHLGDWGTQFGKMLAAYKLWGDAEKVEKGGVAALLELYVRFHKEAENNPELDDLARSWFKKIEDFDEEATTLFNKFKELTLAEAFKVYDRLRIKFDSYAGESFYNDKLDAVVNELEAKGLLRESEGAKVVDLEAYNMPPCIIVKSDGASLYSTRDIAAALYRKKTYDFDKCLYVVAYQQNLHFKQWFKVIELMGYPWAKDLEHIAFGMVSLPDGAIKSRAGNVVFLEDVLNRAVEKSLQVITEKSPDLENKKEIAEQVGVGAVIFSVLYNNRIKDIVFNYDKVLNFDGETGPYVQYTHARCCSVLAKGTLGREKDFSALDNEESVEVVKLLDTFPDAVREAADKREPCVLSRHIVELAKAYNKFYLAHRIINAPEGAKNVRLMLTSAVRQVIKNGLTLLGMGAPEKM